LLGITQVDTEKYFAKHTNITIIYKDNENRNYLQKELKFQAGRLG